MDTMHNVGCSSRGSSLRCDCDRGQDRRARRRAVDRLRRNRVTVVEVALGFEWTQMEGGHVGRPLVHPVTGERLRPEFGSFELRPWRRG